MPSFLVTPRMDPALASRVLASVRGGRPTGRRPGSRNLWRLSFVLLIVGASAAIGWGVRDANQKLRSAQDRLIHRVTAELGAQPPSADQLLPHAEKALLLNAQNPPLPVIVPGEPLTEVLSQSSSLYVRGSLGDFRDSAGVGRAAAETKRDALFACLLSPPIPDRMLGQVREVYRGRFFAGPPFDRSATLHQLVVSAAYGSPSFIRRVEAAQHPKEVKNLELLFERSNLAATRVAAHARLLVYAMDEPKPPGTPSFIDGASEHVVRLGVIDLISDETLLRLRIAATPSSFPKQAEQRYLAGLSDCGVAREAHRLEASIRGGAQVLPSGGP